MVLSSQSHDPRILPLPPAASPSAPMLASQGQRLRKAPWLSQHMSGPSQRVPKGTEPWAFPPSSCHPGTPASFLQALPPQPYLLPLCPHLEARAGPNSLGSDAQLQWWDKIFIFVFSTNLGGIWGGGRETKGHIEITLR